MRRAKPIMVDYPVHVFLIVLGSAVLHASWNALIKGGQDRLLHTAAIVFWAGVISIPFLFIAEPPARESWPYLAISNAIHMVYYVSLASAYRTGNLSFAYPVIRGSAPLIVALGSVFIFHDALGTMSWLGILMVSAGVLTIAMRTGQHGSWVTIGWSLLCATTIAIYSLADGHGARLSQSVTGYGAWMYLLEAVLFLSGMILFGRGPRLVRYIGTYWRTTLLGGVMSALAYGISLWAMTRAPIALVSATRETSVLFATLIGVWFMKERLSWRQWTGAIVVVLGTMLLRG
jgi:drug/metabolite transporter (DMT)-like permease